MTDPTDAQLASVRRAIELATKVGRARSDELFRAVNILQDRALIADPPQAIALLEAAMAILREPHHD